MKKILGLLLIPLFMICVNQAYSKNSQPFSYDEWNSKLRQQGIFDETHMVSMRDGTKLSTTVHKSPLGGPFPAILIRTPYGKDDERLQMLQLILLKGYALVIQDVRGRYGSEGDDMVFVNDGWGDNQDGYDTVEWIAAQSWCNGKVGTWGPSAMGITQNLMAPTRPPHLVCQVIAYAASTMYGQASYQSGVFRKSLVEGWLSGTGLIKHLPIFKEHPVYDDFWAQMDSESKHAEVNVPALFVGGWYDCFQEGTLSDFIGRQTLGDEGARNNQKLVMGPWTHVNELEQQQGQLTYPINSMLEEEIDMSIDWFDYWMQGIDSGIMNEPVVMYYVMGDVDSADATGNEWRTSDVWPIDAQQVPFYLHQDGALSINVPDTAQTSQLQMNPTAPVSTKGGANLEIPEGPYDQATLESRDDVLVFSTAVLDKPLEITGRIKAILYAATNLSDNDLTVRVTDVYPDGRSMLVCDGIVRASFRESLSDPTAITPGEIYQYEVDCWSTSIIFNTGHRMRIIVANTNYPRFDLNPLYQALGQDGNPSEAITTLHLSPEYPSHLLVPAVNADITNIKNWLMH